MEADFGGWATKTGLKCTDGRTIMRGAFEHMDKQQVPLVFQHAHSDIENVLGHVLLENHDEGVRAYAYFNDTPKAQIARSQVRHGDLKHLSIYANQLVEKGKNVVHGMIREVSLVLAGANPGAVIDFINLAHNDGSTSVLDDEAIIHTGIEIELGDEPDDDPDDSNDLDDDPEDNLQHADNIDQSMVSDIWDSMTEEQQTVAEYLIGQALESVDPSAQHSDDPTGDDLAHKEGADDMASRNVFDQDKTIEVDKKNVLSHEDVKGIFADAVRSGSLKEAATNYALQHGIDSIETLFPDAKMATGTIELEKRRTEWVATVLNGTRHTPFSRIKTFTADLTQAEARAKGYIKGNYKIEEWFGVAKRTTSPTTIYKKQKLDRDDMLDITDFDIVAFLKAEMRLMLEEEIARAILIGDGRSIEDEDKVKDPLGASDGVGIRSILNDHELFVTTVYVNVSDANSTYDEIIDAVMNGMEYYKGSSTPDFYTTIPEINKFLQIKDTTGRRIYDDKSKIASMLGVNNIYNVEPMKEITDLVGIIVNLDDYNVGTDQGGEISLFDFFDIDYNQQKYLLETRMSGALVRPKTAIVIKKTAAANVLATPVKPAFVASTGVITIPTVTGVVYKDDNGTTLTAGPQTALAAGETATIYTVPASGYYFADNANDSWPFKRPAS